MGNVGSHSEGEEEEEEAAAEGGGGGGGGGGTASIVTWSNSNGNWAAATSESPPPGAMEAAFPGVASPPPASSSSSSSAASTLPPPAVLLGQARLREEAAARLREVPSAEPLLSRHHAALVRWLEERLGRGEHAISLEQLCEALEIRAGPAQGTTTTAAAGAGGDAATAAAEERVRSEEVSAGGKGKLRAARVQLHLQGERAGIVTLLFQGWPKKKTCCAQRGFQGIFVCMYV